MYMPTVARFTARDPLPQYGESILFGMPYWYSNNSPVLLIDPSGMITITGIDPFNNSGDCGGELAYTWDFELSKTGKKLCGGDSNLVNSVIGYFVQKVQIWCKNEACPTGCGDCPTPPEKRGEPDVTFYEAWQVKENSKFALIRDQIKYTDKFNWVAVKSNCGYRIVVGEVRFFCDKDTGNLGKIKTGGKWKVGTPFDKNDCQASAGDLPATDDPEDVKFWDGKRKDGSSMSMDDSKQHEATFIYECCKADGTGPFTGKATPKPPKKNP